MPDQTRQLAAIMFTDIQGYTALMQKDEQRALQIRNKHREVFNAQTEKHHGKILQYYGDGTLSIFNSAIDAVNCAIEMQLAFQEQLNVPVRIGIHTGDVLFSEEEIIGDGVNIASRIESMAVPGSIFVSDKVYDEIKNHTSIQARSLKSFNFKNVEKPIEVFAISNEGLVIPDERMLRATSEDATHAQDQAKQKTGITKSQLLWMAVAVIAVAASLAVVFYLQRGTKVQPITSIAVLPLDDISEGPTEDYYSAGMTEALIAELSKIRELRVISRTSAMRYKNTTKSVPEIARELDIDALIEGSIIRTENKVRIVAQLIGTKPERHLWAQSFDRDLTDVLSLYSEVADAIADEVEVAITPDEQVGKEEVPKVKPEAHEAYLKGLYHINNKSPHGLFTGLNYLLTAVELDSSFANAYGWLAYTYVEIANFGIKPAKEMFPKAQAAAEMALSLNNNLEEAYASLGRMKMIYEFDWVAAEEEFRKAIEINSNSGLSIEWYADYLFAQGRHQEAIELVKKSINIDPFSTSSILHLGQFYWMQGEFDRAIEALEKAIELDPNFVTAVLFLGNSYTAKGMFEEGILNLNKAKELAGGEDVFITISLAINYAVSGKTEDALQLVRELELTSAEFSTSSVWIAAIYAALDMKDKAFEWLEISYSTRSAHLFLLNNIQLFDKLRSETEFVDLQQKIGLASG